MRVGVLGTGVVGVALGTRLVEVGHDVVLGSRTPDNATGSAWAAGQAERAAAGTFADAARHGEVVINATPGAVSLDALLAAGADHLAGKVLIDVSNPMVGYAVPPTLDPIGDDSNAERIQRAFPSARVVKSLNTVNCEVMVRPSTVLGDHDVFMAGNDPVAKDVVRSILVDFGWPETSVRDLGDLTSARALETYLFLWLSLRMSIGHNAFNIRVVT